jgi:transcriptional regulator with XRE-family HTH domain
MLRTSSGAGTSIPSAALRPSAIKRMRRAPSRSPASSTSATIAQAEHGDEVVNFAKIRKLAEALGISTDELLQSDPEALR